jgi:hypothetical protein
LDGVGDRVVREYGRGSWFALSAQGDEEMHQYTRKQGLQGPRISMQLLLAAMVTIMALLLPIGLSRTAAETNEGCIVESVPDATGVTITIDCYNLYGDDGTGGDYPDEGPSGEPAGEPGGGGGIEPPVYIEDDPPQTDPPAETTPTSDPFAYNCVDEFGVPMPCPDWGDGSGMCEVLTVGAIVCTIGEQFYPPAKLPCAFVKAAAASCNLLGD